MLSRFLEQALTVITATLAPWPVPTTGATTRKDTQAILNPVQHCPRSARFRLALLTTAFFTLSWALLAGDAWSGDLAISYAADEIVTPEPTPGEPTPSPKKPQPPVAVSSPVPSPVALPEVPPVEVIAAPTAGSLFGPADETSPEQVEVAVPATFAAPANGRFFVPSGRSADGLSLHVLAYVGLILGAASEVGVDPALIAALMEVEGSGVDAVSPAGAAGLMQLMPDKLLATDDPFDPPTNILRAAQLLRRLTTAYSGDLIAVAAAYFGSIDHAGNVTDDSDGNVTGSEYVARFAAAYERWAVAFQLPSRPLAIRPVIRQRNPRAGATGVDQDMSGATIDGPDRDQWYLFLDRPEPVMPPVFS